MKISSDALIGMAYWCMFCEPNVLQWHKNPENSD